MIKENQIRNIEDQIINRIGPYDIRERDLKTLDGKAWLVDVVLNSFIYLNIYNEYVLKSNVKIRLLDTFFNASLQLSGPHNEGLVSRGVEWRLIKYDIIVAPFHLDNHWMLVIIDFSKKYLMLMNSLHYSADNVLQLFADYLCTVAMTQGKELQWDQWTVLQPVDFPRQRDSHDCGVYVCSFVTILCKGAGVIPKSFTAVHRESIRKSITTKWNRNGELKSNKLKVKMIPVTTNIEIVKSPPPGFGTTVQYLQHAVKSVFRTNFKICLLGDECLQPRNNEMVLCEGICRDFYHYDCLHVGRNLNANESFYCAACLQCE